MLQVETDVEVARLRAAVQRHRASIRPSQWRDQDLDLYRAVAGEDGDVGVVAHPPEEYREVADGYYGSPY